jgi:NAD(P) transhydrogenase subunit alpha
MSQLQEIITLSDQIRASSDMLVNKVATIAYNSSGSSDILVLELTIFILAAIVGYFVVWKVTPALHTPLMAVTNAISGVVLIGAIIALGSSKSSSTLTIISFIAVVITSINIFGGFLVTKRMLEMFKR